MIRKENIPDKAIKSGIGLEAWRIEFMCFPAGLKGRVRERMNG